MAAVLRRGRPLLALAQPGFDATPTVSGLAARLTRPQRRTMAASAPWQAARAATRRPKGTARTESSPAVSAANGAAVNDGLMSFRIPETFVPPTWSTYYTQPAALWKLGVVALTSWARDVLAETLLRVRSKETLLAAPRFKAQRRALVPLAKNLHYEMHQAVAAGDTATLRTLLTGGYMDEVAALIAHRPRHQQCSWELLAYHGTPRVVSHKIAMLPGTSRYVRQAVVAIRSRQRFTWQTGVPETKAAAPATSSAGGVRRRTRTTATGAHDAAVREPTVVEKDVKENLVLMATADPVTYKTSPWRVFGFIEDTTPDAWDHEKRLMQRVAGDAATERAQPQQPQQE